MKIKPHSRICKGYELLVEKEYEVLLISNYRGESPVDLSFKINNELGNEVWIDDWDCEEIPRIDRFQYLIVQNRGAGQMTREVKFRATGEITFKFEFAEKGESVGLPDKPEEEFLKLIKEHMIEEMEFDSVEIISSNIEIEID